MSRDSHNQNETFIDHRFITGNLPRAQSALFKLSADHHAYGIAVQAGIVFGFDSDTPAIFQDTIEFLEQTGVQNATFNILTPFPGTPLFKRLEAEGRILS